MVSPHLEINPQLGFPDFYGIWEAAWMWFLECDADNDLCCARGDQLIAHDIGHHGKRHISINAERVVVDLQPRRKSQLLESRICGIGGGTRVGGLVSKNDLADRAEVQFSEFQAGVVNAGGGINLQARAVACLGDDRCVQLAGYKPMPVLMTENFPPVVEARKDIDAAGSELHVASDSGLLPIPCGKLESQVDAGGHVRRESGVVGVHPHVAQSPPVHRLFLAHVGFPHLGMFAMVMVIVDVEAVAKWQGRRKAPLIVEEVLEPGRDPVGSIQFVRVVLRRGRTRATPILALGDERVFGPEQPARTAWRIGGSPKIETIVDRANTRPGEWQARES